MFLKCLSQGEDVERYRAPAERGLWAAPCGVGTRVWHRLVPGGYTAANHIFRKGTTHQSRAFVCLNNYLRFFVVFFEVLLCEIVFPFPGVWEPPAPCMQLQGWQHCCCGQICGTSGQHWVVSSHAHSVWWVLSFGIPLGMCKLAFKIPRFVQENIGSIWLSCRGKHYNKYLSS